jgi:DNA-binding transcriptional LysR family regulator
VAIRQGNPPDSRLVARKLEDAPVGVYASPAYLRARGAPQNLSDLQDAAKHTLLPFVLPSTGRAMPWLFVQDGQPLELAPHSNVQVSEEPLGAVMLARAGMGLVQTMGWIAHSYAAELTEVLQPFAGRTRPFYVLYPQNRHLAARVRVLVDYLMLNQPLAQ